MSNESGAINIKVGQSNLALVRKVAKKLSMPPSRLAKIILMDAIAKINRGEMTVEQPKISLT